MHVRRPDTVAKTIAATIKTLNLQRFDLKYSVGQLRADLLRRNIALYGTEVVPRVRRLLNIAE